MKHRLVRLTVALGIIGGTMGLTAGVAASQPAASQVDLSQVVCELLGGTYISDWPGSFFCYLPDGTVVICSDGVCTTVPPPRTVPSRVTVVRAPITSAALVP